MACTSHCNQCLAHPGYIGPRTLSTWTDPTLDTTILIKATHFNQLRTALLNELAVRGIGSQGMYAAQGVGNLIYGNFYKALRHNCWLCEPGYWPGFNATHLYYMSDPLLDPGYLVQDESTTAFRAWVNFTEGLCVCNCNYACTCDCNYCTCDCNNTCTCDLYYYTG